MATYLVAVSGGVDSVCLLDILAQTENRLIVAHVDHGIRGEESAADARFVAALAQKYGLPFVSSALHLAAHASEELARAQRYDFLLSQAKKHHATIATAHHADDVVETIALNLTRGTGWRGLAVLARAEIYRPLINLQKTQLYDYAVRRKLEWTEDATNASDAYLRNRLRRKLAAAQVDEPALLALRARQLQLSREVARQTDRLLARFSGSRYVFGQLDEAVACELLASDIARQTGRPRPTRPRASRALLAVRAARPGSRYDVGDGIFLSFTTRTFRAKVI